MVKIMALYASLSVDMATFGLASVPRDRVEPKGGNSRYYKGTSRESQNTEPDKRQYLLDIGLMHCTALYCALAIKKKGYILFDSIY